MTCPNCKQKITSWQNSWGRGNAKCILCNKEFNVRMDDHGQFVAASPAPEKLTSNPAPIFFTQDQIRKACES